MALVLRWGCMVVCDLDFYGRAVYEQIRMLECWSWCSVKPFMFHFGHISESTVQTENANGQLKETSYFCWSKIVINKERSEKFESSQLFSF